MNGVAKTLPSCNPAIRGYIRQFQLIQNSHRIIRPIQRRLGQHGKVGGSQMSPNGLHGFAGHVCSRQSFAPSDRTIVQFTADDQRLVFGAQMRSMTHWLSQRDGDLKSGQTADSHKCAVGMFPHNSAV